MEYTDPRAYQVICQRGLSPERCLEQKDADFARSKAVNVGIAGDYKNYLDQGDCYCQASWAALYDAGIGRV